jgi:hypothetical protein
MTTYGTAHFVTFDRAVAYYRAYVPLGTRAYVRKKVNEGEIHIGAPRLKPGQRLMFIDNATRYAITEA